MLDLLGLLLVAAGGYFLAEPFTGRAGLMVAGAVLLAGSAVASREPRPNPLWPRLVRWVRAKVARGGAR